MIEKLARMSDKPWEDRRNSTAQCSGEVRWIKRGGRDVLQQLWVVTVQSEKTRAVINSRNEWWDVPLRAVNEDGPR